MPCREDSSAMAAPTSGSTQFLLGGTQEWPLRWNITERQRQALTQVYLRNPYPSADMRRQLAEEFGVSQRQVQVWFRNQRQRAKRSTGMADAVHVPSDQPIRLDTGGPGAASTPQGGPLGEQVAAEAACSSAQYSSPWPMSAPCLGGGVGAHPPPQHYSSTDSLDQQRTGLPARCNGLGSLAPPPFLQRRQPIDPALASGVCAVPRIRALYGYPSPQLHMGAVPPPPPPQAFRSDAMHAEASLRSPMPEWAASSGYYDSQLHQPPIPMMGRGDATRQLGPAPLTAGGAAHTLEQQAGPAGRPTLHTLQPPLHYSQAYASNSCTAAAGPQPCGCMQGSDWAPQRLVGQQSPYQHAVYPSPANMTVSSSQQLSYGEGVFLYPSSTLVGTPAAVAARDRSGAQQPWEQYRM